MIELSSKFDPTWVLMPINNDRTAWRPFGLPMLLVVPQRRNPLGQDRPDSNISCTKIYVEDAPTKAIVSGHDHKVRVAQYDQCGNEIPGSAIGFEQQRYPDRELYSRTFTHLEMADNLISMPSLNYYRLGPGGILDTQNPISYQEAKTGDFFGYTARGYIDSSQYPQEAYIQQPFAYVEYLKDADYYDFSGAIIDVELLPPAKYNLVYQTQYYVRQRAARGTGELLCIDITKTALAVERFQFNHPGELMEEFYRLTPSAYMTESNKSKDTTLALYRPLVDALQDIYDEQNLLEKVNWVYSAPNEAIPYIGALLGWDLPYYPDSLDSLRRTVLRNTSRLQESKGSRQAIVDLFRLLGIEILLANLWWSADGKKLIRPNEPLGSDYADQQIDIVPVQQFDALVAQLRPRPEDISVEYDAPLLFRPQAIGGLDGFSALRDSGDVYLDAFVVEVGSEAHERLSEIVSGIGSNPGGYGKINQTTPVRYATVLRASRDYVSEHTCQINCINSELLRHTFERDGKVSIDLKPNGVCSYSQVRLSNGQPVGVASGPLGIGLSDVAVRGASGPLVSKGSAQLLRDTNTVRLSLADVDCYGRFDAPPQTIFKTVFVFASYVRQEVVVPDKISDLQSNRFDIQLLQAEAIPPLAGQRTYINATILDFAFEFLNKVRAFHSLLNVMRLVLELTETYETTRVCVGGDVQQRPDTEMGQLQVPPAIIPKPLGDNNCDVLDPEKRGYKREDIVLRLRELANLPEEHQAYRRLDGPWTNIDGTTSLRSGADVYQITGPRVAPSQPSDREECKFNHLGQDRVLTGTPNETRGVENGPDPNASQGTKTSAHGERLSPGHAVDRGVYGQTGPQVSTNSNSSAFGSFVREYTEAGEPVCEPDGVTDYCYEGRAKDELLYRPTNLNREWLTQHPGPISMGEGAYWTYPGLALQYHAGTAEPGRRSMTQRTQLYAGNRLYLEPGYDQISDVQHRMLNIPYGIPPTNEQDNFLGRMYRAYGRPQSESLHFSDSRSVDYRQSRNLALSHPDIGIAKEDIHFPGCRFIRMEGVLSDFVSDQYKKRPWDIPVCYGAGACSQYNQLGVTLTIGEDGDEYLLFDDEWYEVPSNGIRPDIQELGAYSSSIGDHMVVHEIYSSAPPGHPSVTLDLMSYGSGVIEVEFPLFHSYLEESGVHDFADGYPSSTGVVPVLDLTVDTAYATFEDTPTTWLFTVSDGILTESEYGMRLDGGYLVVDGGTDGMGSIDWREPYGDSDGTYDWSPDRVAVLQTMIADEFVGSECYRLDGSIPSMFELLPGVPDNPLRRLAGESSPRYYQGE